MRRRLYYNDPNYKTYRNFIRSIIVFPQDLTVLDVEYIHIRQGYIVQRSNLDDIIEARGQNIPVTIIRIIMMTLILR